MWWLCARWRAAAVPLTFPVVAQGWVGKEQKRIEKLAADKMVKKDKRELFSNRLNVLLSFAPESA